VPPARDEVAALAATMNAMLGRLGAAAEAQRRFVADASHELRSPLATVQVGLDYLAAQRAGGPELRQLHRLQAETGRMGRLVADLGLPISREIVAGHGGEIGVAERDGPVGAVLHIRLPLPAVPAA
jgi:signal transduction histidine kinase